jgi:hypothetical protein
LVSFNTVSYSYCFVAIHIPAASRNVLFQNAESLTGTLNVGGERSPDRPSPRKATSAIFEGAGSLLFQH